MSRLWSAHLACLRIYLVLSIFQNLVACPPLPPDPLQPHQQQLEANDHFVVVPCLAPLCQYTGIVSSPFRHPFFLEKQQTTIRAMGTQSAPRSKAYLHD
jgi:hypothetical protein